MAERKEKSSAVVRRPEARPVWDPWAELANVRRHFDEFFNRALSDWPFGRVFADTERVFEPPVDLVETAEEFLLRAYLPGIPRDQIQLEVEPERVTLSGERQQPTEEEGTITHLRGLGYGKFCTSMTLPSEVVPEKAKARYHDGILEVHLPKAEHARWRKPVKIAVESA